MKDLQLNNLTHDLDLVNFDLVLTEGNNSIKQALKIRLLFFVNDWYLDINEGIPFYENIYDKNISLTEVDNIIKTVILKTDGVNEIISYNSNFNKETRKFNIDFKVNTIYGEVSLQEGI